MTWPKNVALGPEITLNQRRSEKIDSNSVWKFFWSVLSRIKLDFDVGIIFLWVYINWSRFVRKQLKIFQKLCHFVVHCWIVMISLKKCPPTSLTVKLLPIKAKKKFPRARQFTCSFFFSFFKSTSLWKNDRCKYLITRWNRRAVRGSG